MKRFLIIFIAAFVCANTYGQNICAGKIICAFDPTETSNAVFGLQAGSNYYILSINSHLTRWGEKLIIEDTEYFLDDRVVITGTTNIKQYINSEGYWREYLELEIETIEKLSPDRNIQQYLGTYEVQEDRYCCGFELMWTRRDMTWNAYAAYVVCSKTSLGNSSIGVANLPKGIYLYRLLQNNGAVHSGKLMLK